MKKLLLCLSLLLLAGCVSTQSIVTGTRRTPVEASAVKVYSSAPEGAEEIALLNVTAGGTGQYGIDLAVSELKKKAGAVGANGVVILATGTETHAAGGIGTYIASTGTFIQSNTTEQNTVVKAKAVYVR